MYVIDEALPDVHEYQALRAAVGWGSPPPDACRTALAATPFAVLARHRGHPVGMARAVGDGTVYLLIVDVVVHPDHQGRGLGRGMVDRLVRWAAARGTRNVLLVADDGVVPFYTSLGFRSDDGNHLMRHAPE